MMTTYQNLLWMQFHVFAKEEHFEMRSVQTYAQTYDVFQDSLKLFGSEVWDVRILLE